MRLIDADKVPGEYDDEDLDKMIAERCAFCPLDRL